MNGVWGGAPAPASPHTCLDPAQPGLLWTEQRAGWAELLEVGVPGPPIMRFSLSLSLSLSAMSGLVVPPM